MFLVFVSSVILCLMALKMESWREEQIREKRTVCACVCERERERERERESNRRKRLRESSLISLETDSGTCFSIFDYLKPEQGRKSVV